MFGQSAFGTNTSTFGNTGTNNLFGQSQSGGFGGGQAKPVFGAATSTFGQPAGGGLFGSTSTPSTGGGLFGATNNTATSSFGGGGMFGQQQQQQNTAFGSNANTAFKPTGFGATTQSGGLFGSNTTTQQTGGLFSQPSTSFGGGGGGAFGGGGATSFGGFGASATQQAGTGHVKFNPVTGSDTMLKSGVQTSISTRHQCITCMKEYENKSLEELRCEDYIAGRKGTAGGMGSTGLFGAAPNQTAGASGGLFGSNATSTSGGLFGQQQRPLFGSTGFGGTTTSTATSTFGGFGQQSNNTQQAGSVFGAAKPFGQATTTASGFGGFGQTNTQAGGGGLFGGNNNTNRPFGVAAPQQSGGGGLFGSTTPAQSTSFGGFGQQQTTSNTGFGGFGQPQQQQQSSIGLFGSNNNNQAKPAFGGFSGTQTTSFGGFGGTSATTTQSGGGLFGGFNNQQQKPAFGGFGGQTSTGTTGTFGGFGTNTSTGGGLFGNTQNKPAFSSIAQPTTGFGTNTGGGLFSNQNKPGGLFGGTSTTGFGTSFGGGGATSTSGFGGFGSGGGGGLNFGTNTAVGTGGSFNFSGGFGGAGQQQQPQNPAATSIQQQLLLSLASSPFGENPLFKSTTETGKRESLLKPTNPTTQKLATTSQYKVSPHRNVKVRAKALNSTNNKSSFFEGLDDDLPTNNSDSFVPRTSVKKLILRAKSDITSNSVGASTLQQKGSSVPPAATGVEDASQDQSLTVPLDEPRLVLSKKAIIGDGTADADQDYSLNNTAQVDDSFAALNTRKKNNQDITLDETEDCAADGANKSSFSYSSNNDDNHPAGIVLNRPGYYTIPGLAELKPDSEGNCYVDGFTIGREGYGNVYYPGQTNVAGLNLDQIVVFRHKEVIVYPDDSKKPALGEGLNKKAQITLDKVWPVDKSDQSLVKSPAKIANLNYEEKLIRACNRLGARYIEYRPETGSWVFKVDHFSKYGLDDSDEEDIDKVDNNNKKVKTLQLERRQSGPGLTADKLSQPVASVTTTTLTARGHRIEILDNRDAMEGVETDGVGKSLPKGDSTDNEEKVESDTEMRDFSPANNKDKIIMRSALFGGAEEEGMSASGFNFNKEISLNRSRAGGSGPRPIILQQRSTNTSGLFQTRPRLIEDMASSMMVPPPSKGLGGSFSMFGGGENMSLINNSLNATQGTTTSQASLLRSNVNTSVLNNSQYERGNIGKLGSSRVATYSLTSGYDKYAPFPSSSGQSQDPYTLITPRYIDVHIPLEKSLLFSRHNLISDAGLFHGRRYRVGFGNCGWTYGNIDPMAFEGSWPSSPGFDGGVTGIISFFKIQQDVSSSLISSLERWLEVSLKNSECEMPDDGDFDAEGPYFKPVMSVETIHELYEESCKQFQDSELMNSEDADLPSWLTEVKQTFHLLISLWGNMDIKDLTPQGQGVEDDDAMEHEDVGSGDTGPETHPTTMGRRRTLTSWLEAVVKAASENEDIGAREKGSDLGRVTACMQSGKVAEACSLLQSNGDHRSALLLSQVGCGGNATKLVQDQLERWSEVGADEYISSERLSLYSMVAGHPVFPSSKGLVNTCANLDWKRSLALHLWYLSHPVASVSDSLACYDDAWKGNHPAGQYSARPSPTYLEDDLNAEVEAKSPLDIKYQLIKLYSDRSHSLEKILTPTTHTNNQLDLRLSWLVYRALSCLGYTASHSTNADRIAAEFASQLENYSLWAWSVFVLLHIADPVSRKAAVMAVLQRHVTLDGEDGIEDWLINTLEVPSCWIAGARAVLAKSRGKHLVRAQQLIKAKEWSEAHTVILSEIAPTAVVAQNYTHLLELLQELDLVSQTIPGWESGGKVYLEFINMDNAVTSVLQIRDIQALGYELERLKPGVSNLCRTVATLKIENNKQRLAQSEIAKKVAHLMRAVFSYEWGSSSVQSGASKQLPEVTARELAEALSVLPLPEDYALQEMRFLTRAYMKEIINS